MTEDDVSLITEDQIDSDNIKTQRSIPIPADPETFYGQSDSVYIRVKWDNEVRGFSFSVRNELLMNATELTEDVVNLGAFVRGVIEVGMAKPSQCYNIGVQAQNHDAIARDDGLTPEQKDLFAGDPKGSA